MRGCESLLTNRKMANLESQIETESAHFKRRIRLSIIIPFILICLMWIVKSVEVIFGFAFTVGGIYPLTLKGLPGVLLSPFIHADFKHLLSNSIPLFLLSTALFYFYSEISMKILSLAWLFTGFLVWIAGRDAWHIGASGLVYSLASFLFF